MKWMVQKVVFFVCVALCSTLPFRLAMAESDFFVKEVVLSQTVNNRKPEGMFSPPAYCEKDKNGQAAIPIIQITQISKVFFWIKVEASSPGKLRHSWHHQQNGIWRMISEVNLPISPSPGYRMWSFKTLHPNIHEGEWMVVVAPSKEPEHILCITRFSVQ